MDNKLTIDPPESLQLKDIYYVLFRHKWKILLCALAGFVAAGAVYKLKAPLYESETKLLVRYVVDSRSPGTTPDGDVSTRYPQGDTIINTELQILGSFDLAREVATAVGPDKIVADPKGGPVSASDAARVIQSRLRLEAPSRGNVMVAAFSHADPQIAPLVLRHLVDQYLQKHKEIHRSSGIMDDFLTQKADEFRIRAAKTDEELRQVKSLANVISIDETMRAQLTQISRIRDQLQMAQAEFAERQAAFARLTNQPPAKAVPDPSDAATQPDKTDDYRRVVGQLELFLRREQELITQFTPENPQLQEIRSRITEAQKEKSRLEKEDPRLARTIVAPGSQRPANLTPEIDLDAESARIIGLEAKIATLTNQLAQFQQEAATVGEVENRIRELQRRKEVEETQYKFYASGLERSRVDDAIGPGKLPNIRNIEKPTPAAKNLSKLYKMMGMAIAAGLGGGIALAFIIEMFLDQTVRRPGDLQKAVRVPEFISIPRLRRMRPAGALADSPRKALPPTNGAAVKPGSELVLETAPVANPAIQPYADALRDRLMAYFLRNNLTHKPKLVAVTGCCESSGVSTVAAGLAASLSETGDGNVLLVDTSRAEGAAHPFYRGKLACGLDDVLSGEKRNDAQLRDKLFVATATDAAAPLLNELPKRFRQLVPKLKASDYDYIIFDMPPVTQTSISGKLAGFMDLVLLVVESEKTGRSIVAQSVELLRESRANVATVLNKTQKYVPQWVHREFE